MTTIKAQSAVNTDHYRYQVTWSPADSEYVGLVDEFPSLSWLDEDQVKAFAGIRRLVAEVVEDMEQSGETPPTPKSERTYSGKFIVRTSPATHGGIVELAERRNRSLNSFVSELLDIAVDSAALREAQANDDAYRISGAELLAKLDAEDEKH